MRTLIKMRHGLGDNAQFTIILKHIKYYYPDWIVDMAIRQGKHSYFKKYTRNIFDVNEEQNIKEYDQVFDVLWPVPRICYGDLPSSKPTAFLIDVLDLEPIEDFYRGYDITITDKEEQLADEYVSKLPNKPFILIHYLAKTLKNKKSLSHDDAAYICLQILKSGCVPVILDWKGDSPLPDNKNIFNPGLNNPLWQGEQLSSAGTLAALIKRAKLYIGVDSGPLHVAGCTSTPTLGIWHGHHPINFYDLCDNVTHLVPADKIKIKGRRKNRARLYFEKRYNHIYYENLADEIQKHLCDFVN